MEPVLSCSRGACLVGSRHRPRRARTVPGGSRQARASTSPRPTRSLLRSAYPPWWQPSLNPANRRVRTRMHGGVGRGGAARLPYPDCRDRRCLAQRRRGSRRAPEARGARSDGPVGIFLPASPRRGRGPPAYGCSRHRIAGGGLQGGEKDEDVGAGVGPSERAHDAGGDGSTPERRRRMSARRKQDTVLRRCGVRIWNCVAPARGDRRRAERLAGRVPGSGRGVVEDPACGRSGRRDRPS